MLEGRSSLWEFAAPLNGLTANAPKGSTVYRQSNEQGLRVIAGHIGLNRVDRFHTQDHITEGYPKAFWLVNYTDTSFYGNDLCNVLLITVTHLQIFFTSGASWFALMYTMSLVGMSIHMLGGSIVTRFPYCLALFFSMQTFQSKLPLDGGILAFCPMSE